MEILICASLRRSVETAPFRLYPFYAYNTGLIWHLTSFTQVHGDSHIHIHLRKTDAVIALNACTNTLALFCYLLCNYVYCRVGKQYLDSIYKKKKTRKSLFQSITMVLSWPQLVQSIFRKAFQNKRWKKSNRSTWKAILEAVRLRWSNKDMFILQQNEVCRKSQNQLEGSRKENEVSHRLCCLFPWP